MSQLHQNVTKKHPKVITKKKKQKKTKKQTPSEHQGLTPRLLHNNY